jgi:hypothetical protein
MEQIEHSIRPMDYNPPPAKRPIQSRLRELILLSATNRKPDEKDMTIQDEICWRMIEHIRCCLPGSKEFTQGWMALRLAIDGKDAAIEEVEAIRESKVYIVGDRVEKREETLTQKSKVRVTGDDNGR